MKSILHQTIHPQVRTIDGLSIRFAESEPREHRALLLCPWPESLYAYEAGWHRLAEHAHLVAIDLPGFGHSERRESLMAPRAMGEFIVRVANEFGLEQPHLVGPDVGTAASLFAAADFPGRFRSLTVGTGGTSVPIDLGSPLKEWVEAPDVEPWRKLDGREVVTVCPGHVGAVSADGHGPGGLPRRLCRRAFRRVDGVRAHLSEGTAGAPRPAARDPDAGSDHHRRARPGGPTGERRVPPPAPAPQPARGHRRRALHLGRGARPVCCAAHGVVGRRV